LQDTTYSAWALVFLGDVALLQGDALHAQALYEQAVPKLEETKDYPFLALPLRRLGQLAMSQGDLVRAKTFLDRSLADNWRLRDYRGVGASLAALGALSMAEERIERATELFGAVGTILESIRTLLLPFDQQQYDRNLAVLRARIEPATFVAAWTKGQAMSLEQAVMYALEDKTPD
jgi:tetratricopeptide (TPR) repeat protein